jgi:hypothetical protein
MMGVCLANALKMVRLLKVLSVLPDKKTLALGPVASLY